MCKKYGTIALDPGTLGCSPRPFEILLVFETETGLTSIFSKLVFGGLSPLRQLNVAAPTHPTAVTTHRTCNTSSFVQNRAVFGEERGRPSDST